MKNLFKFLIIALGVIIYASCKNNYYNPEGIDSVGFYVYKDGIKFYPDIKKINPKVIENYHNWVNCITNSDGSDIECQECDILYNLDGYFQY